MVGPTEVVVLVEEEKDDDDDVDWVVELVAVELWESELADDENDEDDVAETTLEVELLEGVELTSVVLVEEESKIVVDVTDMESVDELDSDADVVERSLVMLVLELASELVELSSEELELGSSSVCRFTTARGRAALPGLATAGVAVGRVWISCCRVLVALRVAGMRIFSSDKEKTLISQLRSMQGIRVGHTIEWPGSDARQKHDGGEHSARGEVHGEDFVYVGGCCVACLCLCMCVCWW